MSAKNLFILVCGLVCIPMILSVAGCTCDDDDDNQITLPDDDDTDDLDDDDSPCAGCLIGGVCYQDGETNPQNICLYCAPAVSAETWTGNDGVSCDDGLYCNGDDACLAGVCVHTNAPECPDDGLWCNGAEACDEQDDACRHTGSPCVDDNLFCNGLEICDEVNDACLHSGNPCLDNGQWCDGVESCDESDDQCLSSGDPCGDDELFCNGDEVCEESTDSCVHTGNPCAPPDIWCDEQGDQCHAVDCTAVGVESIDTCAATLVDNDGVPQDSGGLAQWCELSEALFSVEFDFASPFWSCWAGCIFTQDCADECFETCQYPPDPGPGCERTVHRIYSCELTFDFDDAPNYYIPEMDAVELCAGWEKDWACYQECLDFYPCSLPPTPQQQDLLRYCLNSCDPSPAVEFDGTTQWGLVDYNPVLDLDIFTMELWFRIDENLSTAGQSYVLAGRYDNDAELEFGWELAVVHHEEKNADVLSFIIVNQSGVWPAVLGYTGLQTNVWYLVAAQFDGNTIWLFLDGQVETVASMSGSVYYNQTGLGFGSRPSSEMSRLKGGIDEIRLSDIVRYDGTYFMSYEFGVDEHTIGLWHLNEKEGLFIADAGTQQLHGAIGDGDLRTWRISRNDWFLARASNHTAQTKGMQARIAEEIHYQNQYPGTYTDSLEDLLYWDRHLTDDPGVTFQFGVCNQSGYTFDTRHVNGDRWFYFTD